MDTSPRLLLVGWDSADWQIIQPLLDAGKLPGVQWLVEGGCSGNLATVEPQLSPMLWTTIATGKMAYDHGVSGFTEVDPASGRVVPVSWASRRCKTAWEILGERGFRSHVIGWFATQGEQHLDGCMVSDRYCHLPGVRPDQDPGDWPPPPPGTYWPPDLSAELDSLRVSPYEIDPEGIVRLFVPDAPTIDQTTDRRLWQLVRLLAEAFSVHSAATHVLERDPAWNLAAIYYRAVDEISHLFMPYHPPQMAGISAADFRLYRGVVEGIYRLHDLFLQRLVQLAGPAATVMLVSDHGFRSDHLRPQFVPNVPAGITAWHRPHGVLAIRGPGIRRAERIHGARLPDITPTLLHACGLPAGADMEGRVLEEVFARRVSITRVPTWESPGGIVRRRLACGTADHRVLLAQFAALGYVEPEGDDPEAFAENTRRENDWNLARTYLDRGRFRDALPLLERCSHERPSRTDYAQVLAACQQALGLLDEAEASVERAVTALGPSDKALLLRASVAAQRGDHRRAIEILESLVDTLPDDPELWLLLAQSAVAVRHWETAEAAARRAEAIDPHDPRPRLALARQQLFRGAAASAAAAALEAIGLDFGNPHAHFLLGAALARAGQGEQAVVALQNCLTLEPRFLRALRLLARIERQLGRQAEATLHEERYAALRDAARQAASVQSRAALRAESEARRLSFGPPLEPGRADVATTAAAAGRVASPVLEFVIVSGLPRSGTSLMMQALQAGGIECHTDGRRAADEDNPEGYWEWEEIKRLPRDPGVIEKAAGKAVKVVAPLLTKLPARHRYKLIFMTRPIEEVVASQLAMLGRQGMQPPVTAERLARVQEQHRDRVLAFARSCPQIDLLEVSYTAFVTEPEPTIAALVAFLPGRFLAGPAVRACIKPALRRHWGRQGRADSNTLPIEPRAGSRDGRVNRASGEREWPEQ